MANAEHQNTLQQGVKMWNTWRVLHPEITPDLRWANLSLANLRGANLAGALLDKTNLSGAMLSRAILNDASLREASLSETNLSSARLEGANLLRADLSRANLSRAVLQNANLSSANLSRTNLFEATLSRVSFEGAYLYETAFGNTKLAGAANLETCHHLGPSAIDHGTLARHPYLPPSFLRGCGLHAWEIEAMKLHDPSLPPTKISDIAQRVYQTRTAHAIQLHNLFLSFSHPDTAFIERLEAHLDEQDILYWRDVHDAPTTRLKKNIVIRGMRPNPTVLLTLSEHSVKQSWVTYEINQARTIEDALQRNVLCLIALDDSWQTSGWSEEIMDQVVQYPILDFSNWEDPEAFRATYTELIPLLNLLHIVAPEA